MKYFDFLEHEDRRPEPPLEYSAPREFLWQVLATMTVIVGFWYLWWRWTSSLNYDALWFSIPMVAAETCAFVGLLLFFHNIWATRDFERRPPPKFKGDVVIGEADNPISVDLFLPTYDEDPELVRYSIRDAKALEYPYEIDLNIHVLDDGGREEMQRVSEEEKVNYITREGNLGFKAGNLRNAMEQTFGEFIVICDADTRVFPSYLKNTLGYFRDPDVAWVQTPQWFYDIPEGERLHESWKRKCGVLGEYAGYGVQAIFGRITVGHDPFVNDPKLFYDILLRRRNAVSASFCCGAGSIHRREAVMEAALKSYAIHVDREVSKFSDEIEDETLRNDFEEEMRRQMSLDTEMTPYKFHVSEDIYTSIVLHSDAERNWKSVLHPQVESKMLSPLDLQSWVVQRFKYAGGTIDIAANDNPLFQRGMGFRKKLMYAMTFWSYLAPLWNVLFLAAPIVSLFSGIAPVSTYSTSFFLHLLPFLLLHEFASMVGMWGIDNHKGRSLNLAFFSINLRAIWTVARGQQIKFPTTPKERQDGTFLHLVIPQLTVVGLTLAGIVWATVHYFLNPTTQGLGMLLVNSFWGLNNCVAMWVLISAAIWKPREDAEPTPEPINSKQEVLAS